MSPIVTRIVVVSSLMFGAFSCEETSEKNSISEQQKQFVGTWEENTTNKTNGNFPFERTSTTTLKPDFTHEGTTTGRLWNAATGETMFEFTGVQRGTWAFDGAKLGRTYDEMKIIDFNSNDPGMTREKFGHDLKSRLGGGTIQEVTSIKLDEISLLGGDGAKFTWNRHSPK